MTKLYADEKELEFGKIVSIEEQEPRIDIYDEIKDTDTTLDIVTEAFKTASSELNLITDISTTLNLKKRTSVDYFTSLENYTPVIESIANKLGVKSRIPSLEDFKNPYGTEASHQIAMEGFFDFIKKIWEKLKDVLSTFFKKLGMFFKRLIGADLDLANYEEYLKKMIVEIKSKKLEISDNTVMLDSRLPSLIADKGIDIVTSDYVLTNLTVKFNNFSHVINDVFNEGLIKFEKEHLKDLSARVDSFFNRLEDCARDGSGVVFDLDTLEAGADILKIKATDGLSDIYKYPISDRDLPDSIYEGMMNSFDRNEVKDLNCFSIIDADTVSSKVPKNFNSYFCSSTSSKGIFISAHSEENSYVANKINPITNRDNLIKLYENYTRLNKNINLKKIDEMRSNIDDATSKIIEKFKHSVPKAFEEVEKQRTKAISEIENATIVAKNIDVPYDPSLICGITGIALFRECMSVEEVNRLANNITKELRDLQAFFIKFLSAIENMLSTLSLNLTGTYKQLQFEVVKYLYNSAKLYK